MTKDFNEQQRGGVRPSSRNQSSGRHGEERSPRPTRLRLNRETVDRAWESGASRDHADYRPRTTNGQPLRDNRRRDQYGNSPSAQNDRRPYSNQQNNVRRYERTPNDNHNPGPRSSDSRRFDDRRSSDRRNFSESAGGAHPRSQSGPGFRDNERYRDQRPPYRHDDRNRSRGDERRGFDRDNRSLRTFNDSNRQRRDFQQPNTQNPRWRSRPMAQNDDQPRGQQDFNRNERFWTEISHDVEALVEPIDASIPVKKAPTEDREPAVTRRPRRSTAAHGKKAREKTAKPTSTGPKPSKRGFKWPTP